MNTQDFLSILSVAEKLKCNTRHSDTSSGRRESVAGHSWRIALMAMLLEDEFPDVHIDKVIKMCLIHDLGEAFTGDIATFNKTEVDSKKENELYEEWIEGFPEFQKVQFQALLSEMSEMTTNEAKLYKALDKLEAVIQHNEADISTWLPLEYDLQLTYGSEEVAFSPYLLKLKEDIDKWTRDKINEASDRKNNVIEALGEENKVIEISGEENSTMESSDDEKIGKLRNMASLYLLCGDEILLLYRQGSSIVSNMWVGSAGGHFEKEELNDAKSCVLREMNEELSLAEDQISDLKLRYISIRRSGGEIRQNYYFFAELKNGTEMELKSNEGLLKWFNIDEIGDLEMPYTARYVINHYLEIGRYTDKLYGGISNGEKVVFSEMP